MPKPLFIVSALLSALLAVLLTVDLARAAERQVVAPAGTDVGLPFSPGVWHGDLLFLSGAIGNQPGTLDLEPGLAAQTRQTLLNLEVVLEAAGLGLDRVVSADIYLSDLRQFPLFWEVLREKLPTVPAAAAVEAGIAIPEGRIEMGFVAARPGVDIRTIQPSGWASGDGGRWAVAAGDALFLSGMASLDPKTLAFVPGDISSQTRVALDNVTGLLRASGLGWRHVVRCRVFLPDARDFSAMNETYRSVMAREGVGDSPPARATVEARLLHPEARFGIQCLAVRGERQVVEPVARLEGRPFSSAIAAGQTLYLAGMVGRGASGYATGVAAQTRQALENLSRTLEAAGLGFDDVIAATVYLSDSRHYQAMNEVYREVVGSPPPARATVATPLMSPEALVEIEMTASTAD